MRDAARALAIGILLAAPTASQVGRALPESAQLADFEQTGAESVDDLVGRAVLIEFFAHWCQPCKISTERLNQLHERFEGVGLTVLGVTPEPRSSTDRFMRESGARYAYAFDQSGALQRDLGIESYPTAVLIDPTGTVVWKGHTQKLSDGVVLEHIEGAFKTPVWEWPKSTRGAVKALKKRRYGRALAALEKLDDPGVEETRAAILSIVEKRVKMFDHARKAGDYLTARRIAHDLQDELEGLSDEQSHARRFLDEARADDEIRRVLRMQEKLEKLRTTRLGGTRDVERLIDKVEALRRQAAGTYPAREAQEFLRELRAELR